MASPLRYFAVAASTAICITLFLYKWSAPSSVPCAPLVATSPSSARPTSTAASTANPWHDPLANLATLYETYSNDLAQMRALAVDFCARTQVPAGWGHLSPCLYGIVESEITYLRIRQSKPQRVLEISSAVGYSTLWILKALEDNGAGHLDSFDLVPTPWPIVLPESMKTRWTLTVGDVRQTFAAPQFQNAEYDYVFIDTHHEKFFTKWYTKAVIERIIDTGRPVLFSTHDIYPEASDEPLMEGQMVLEWMALSQVVKNVFSVHPIVNQPFAAGVHVIRVRVLGESEAQRQVGGSNYRYAGTLFFEGASPARHCVGCVALGPSA